MGPAVKSILERVASWPAEDQEELSELAREIEARRSGVYRLSEEERAAIAASRRFDGVLRVPDYGDEHVVRRVRTNGRAAPALNPRRSRRGQGGDEEQCHLNSAAPGFVSA